MPGKKPPKPKATAKALASERKAKGLRQEDLAERYGCSPDAIKQWETGRRMPSFVVVDELTKALGLDPNRFDTLVMQDAQEGRSVANLTVPVGGIQLFLNRHLPGDANAELRARLHAAALAELQDTPTKPKPAK